MVYPDWKGLRGEAAGIEDGKCRRASDKAIKEPLITNIVAIVCVSVSETADTIILSSTCLGSMEKIVVSSVLEVCQSCVN